MYVRTRLDEILGPVGAEKYRGAVGTAPSNYL